MLYETPAYTKEILVKRVIEKSTAYPQSANLTHRVPNEDNGT